MTALSHRLRQELLGNALTWRRLSAWDIKWILDIRLVYEYSIAVEGCMHIAYGMEIGLGGSANSRTCDVNSGCDLTNGTRYESERSRNRVKNT
jgi:hypothetical protein